MKINEVIERHGMQLRDVSREMGMKPSALQSAIDRNLTVKTLRQISEAARIPIAEFFLDELTDTDRQQILAALQPLAQPSQQPAAGTPETEQQQEQSQSVALTPAAAILCPHCGKAITLGVVK